MIQWWCMYLKFSNKNDRIKLDKVCSTWVKVYLTFKWECEKINLILNENFDYFHSVIWNKEMAGFIFYRLAAGAGMLEKPELVRVGTHRHEHTHTRTHTHTHT